MRINFKSIWAQRVQSVIRGRARRSGRSPVATILPPVPPSAEWDEAFLRVESYLRAHHIESRVLLNRLTYEIIDAARRLAEQMPDEMPVTIAVQVAHARIGEWLTQSMGEGDWADERFRARGRLAVLLADVPHECPEHFLIPDPLPPGLRERMASATLHPGPELKLTAMPSAPLEFPLAEAVEGRWETFSRSMFLRAATSWIVLAALLGAAWFTTR